MTNLVETSNWDAGVYEIQTTDAVVGDNGSTIGIANEPGQNLVNRTLWLRNRIAAAVTQAGLTDGTTDNTQLPQAVVLQCASAVALRSIPVPVVPNAQTVLMHTRGQAADLDGLAAIYKWVYNSTTADNGSTVIAPTGQATGRWIACGINATNLGGAAATSYLTTTAAAATYETLTEAAANLAAAETFASTAASTAQSNAETYAAGMASTAQSNAETYAAGAASTAQSNAEAYAVTVAGEAQNAAVASSESYASSVAATAQANAETYTNTKVALYAPLTDFALTAAATGCIHLPGAIVISWGPFNGGANQQAVTFPFDYTTFYAFNATIGGGANLGEIGAAATSGTTGIIYCTNAASTGTWIVIGK